MTLLLVIIHCSGAYIDSKTSMHFTPLLAAICHTQPGPVQLLLSRGANVMVKDQHKNYNALFWAVDVESSEILKVKTIKYLCRDNKFSVQGMECSGTQAHLNNCKLQYNIQQPWS